MSIKTKIVIIGAGTAGLTALTEVKKHTDDFILIDRGPYGTTCARVGCMPSKVLMSIAHNFHKCKILSDRGIMGTENICADIPSVMEYIRKLRDRFASGPAKAVEALKDKAIKGSPRFIDSNTLEVNGKTIITEKTIIATGSSPIIPGAWKSFGNRIITTDNFFEMNNFESPLAVIGLGPVGAELGQALAQLGIEVHCFSLDTTVAGLTDPVISGLMVEILKRDMKLYLGEPAEIGNAGNGKLYVKAGNNQVEVNNIIASLGRKPNIGGLGLEDLGVDINKNGYPVFDPITLRIGKLPVYIAGDVSGLRPIMHEAADEGSIAAYHALNPKAKCLKRRTPMGIVFTAPNAARAGLSYADLAERDFIMGGTDFKSQGRAITEGEDEGLIHIYADPSTGKILGSEMAIPEGEHIAHILTWAIQQDIDLDTLLKMPFYHPTIEEGLRSALRNTRKQISKDHTPGNLPLCSNEELF